MTASMHRATRLGLSLFALGTAFILFVRNPQQNPWLPPCVFRKFIGLDCPGCGSARGMHHLLHGELLQSADHNLLLMPALVVLILGIFHSWTGRGTRAWNIVNKPKLVLWIVLAFWVLRNLPWEPFSWLGSGSGV